MYIDRIALSKRYRHQKIGTKLYDSVIINSKNKLLTCEVNIKPTNPMSLNFHRKLGFTSIEERKLSNDKSVILKKEI